MAEARERLGIAPDEILPLVFAINDSDYMKSLAEILHDAWEPLGVELSVQVTPIERYYSSIDGWNADLFSYSWVGDFGDPLAFLELFRGASSLNVGHYENKEYDLLLEQASLADTAEERYKLLSKAEQLLLDEGMVIPISHPVTLHAIDCDEIGGWSLNPFDVHPLKYLFIKKKQLKIPNVV
jgi:oligopeptide transport system substrate-binding protein